MRFVEFTVLRNGRRMFFAGQTVRSIVNNTHNGMKWAGYYFADDRREVPIEEIRKVSPKFVREEADIRHLIDQKGEDVLYFLGSVSSDNGNNGGHEIE